MRFSSQLIENAVDQMATLPGVGRKTALRLVLHLLKKEESDVERFSSAFTKLKAHIKHCTVCNNLSDEEVCEVCANPSRDRSLLCIVEDIRDV
ncbi:MAG: recombination protein RecR, partial [Flavobacteriales bacterium]|nr:recombination protein RecR [Flavobacteriales bacterium]